MTETLKAPPTDPFIPLLDSLDPEMHEGPTWLTPIRKAGVAGYASSGCPTLSDEDWRFTNLDPMRSCSFQHPSDSKGISKEAFQSIENPLKDPACIRVVLVDGIFNETLSDRLLLPEEVCLRSLKQAVQDPESPLKNHLGQYTYGNDSPFAALNAACFEDGICLKVPKGVQLELPIQIMHVTTAQPQASAIFARCWIHMEAGSKATVMESFHGMDQGVYLSAPTLECLVEDNAYLEHIKVQDESKQAFHMASIYARITRDARMDSHHLSLGGRISRNHIRTHLDGPGLCCTLNGLSLAQGDQIIDHHMVVDHVQPHTESHEYFNGILDDQSRSVFHGRIHVRQVAQKTDAKQTNKNLLLSDAATADTKPQLEIYADDVRCTHGATIGQLDDQAIWYLRARGIPMARARRMLVHAFAGEIIDRIEHPNIRKSLDDLVWEQLEALPHFHAHTSTPLS